MVAGATNALLINSFIPVATIALSWAFLKKQLRGVEWIGVLTSLIGVITIVARGEPLTGDLGGTAGSKAVAAAVRDEVRRRLSC